MAAYLPTRRRTDVRVCVRACVVCACVYVCLLLLRMQEAWIKTERV